MRKLFLTLLLGLVANVATFAIQAEHVLRPYSQSNGKDIMLYLCGDEHYSWYTTADNLPVVKDANGTWRYAVVSNGKLTATTVAVSNVDERTEQEKALIASGKLNGVLEQTRSIHRAQAAKAQKRFLAGSTENGLGQYGVMSGAPMPSIGKYTIPVIMVDFPDRKFLETTTADKLNRYFNEDGYSEDSKQYQHGCVSEYFRDQSNGMFVPTFKIVARVTTSQNHDYYGHDQGDAEGAWRLLSEIIPACVQQGVDFTQFYVNGTVPNVIIYFAGPGANSGGGTDCIWPHESGINGAIGGVNFSSYFVGNEIRGNGTSRQLMGMGVLCHEFSHALGLPDFYDTWNGTTYPSPFGGWDVMDYGGYRYDSYAPEGYTAYEKSFMGWLDLRHLTTPEALTLANPVTDPDKEYAFVLDNEGTMPRNTTHEYVVVENHQEGKWTTFSGLLATRYSYRPDSWSYNTVNSNGGLFRATIVTANGATIPNGGGNIPNGGILQAHLYGNGVNRVDSFRLYNTTHLHGKPLYRIVKTVDGRIMLNFGDSTLRANQTDIPVDGTFYTRVNSIDDIQSGDTIIFVSENEGLALAKSGTTSVNMATVVALNNGVAQGNGLIQRFAALKNSTGQFALRTDDGEYLGGGNAVPLALYPNAQAQVRATIAISNGEAQVVFGGNVAYRYLGFSSHETAFTAFGQAQNTGIQIYKKDNTLSGISAVSAKTKTGNTPRYNLAGQRVNSSYKGVVIQDGKKIIVK